MPIIFPAKCRGVTAGALREVKRSGYSTSAGGLWDERMLDAFRPEIYFSKTEPAGVFMETLDKTKQQIEENTEAILNSGRRLVESAKDTNKQMADVTGKFRDGTERLGNAIEKLMKIAARGDFAETVKLAESLADSLERLAVLEEKGMLDKVMRSMYVGK